MPDDDMGVGTALAGGDSITNETFLKLAQLWGISENGAKELVYDLLSGNLNDPEKEKFLEPLYQKAGDSQGMSIEESKEETLKLLKQVLNKND